jgi:hypothetical protein
VKTGLHDGLRQPQREGVAPDTGPMTGSIHYQQPSTIRGEAQIATPRQYWTLLLDLWVMFGLAGREGGCRARAGRGR